MSGWGAIWQCGKGVGWGAGAHLCPLFKTCALVMYKQSFRIQAWLRVVLADDLGMPAELPNFLLRAFILSHMPFATEMLSFTRNLHKAKSKYKQPSSALFGFVLGQIQIGDFKNHC